MPGAPVPGLIRADIHLDPIDWRGTRSLAEPEALLDGLARTISEGGGRPLGLLTHHRVHDAALWSFLAGLLPVLLRHPAVALLDPADLFRPGAVDAPVPVGPHSPREPLARVG